VPGGPAREPGRTAGPARAGVVAVEILHYAVPVESSAAVRERLRPGRARRESLLRLAWRLESRAGLAALFAAGLAVRLLIAPRAGFYGDLRLFQQWAERLAAVGPGHFYVRGQFADYPPGYLYVLWLLGSLSAAPGYLLLKLPALLADLGLAWAAGLLAVRLAPDSLRARVPVRAAVAAAVLLNPAVLALGAVWGQVDAVPAFLVVCALLLLVTGRRSARRDLAGLLLFAVAVAMKPQSGFAAPVLAYLLYRRYLHGRRGGELLDGALTAGWLAVAAIGLWAVSGLPFGLGPVGLLRFYSHSASVYPVTSANAFNLWGIVGFWRNDAHGAGALTLAGVSALRLGTVAFAAAALYVLWRMHRALGRGADEALVVVTGAAVTSLLAYTLLTRMHERYLFLALATLAPLAFARPLRLAYAALSALFVLDLWYPYAYFNAEWRAYVPGLQTLRVEPWFGWLLGGLATDTWQKKLWSALVTAIALAVAWAGLRLAGRPAPAARRRAQAAPPLPLPHPRPRRPLRLPALARPRLSLPALALPAVAARRWPLALPALASLFGLVALRGETRPAANLNDSAFHLLMVHWAHGQLDEGRVPLDGWFPYLSLGSSFFHHYQSLPQTLTAALAAATGAGDQTVYDWLLYLLLALWPVSVYAGARLLGWDGWTAGAAAAVSPLLVGAPGYGFEHGSYIWAGYGVYSQLFAMWLAPLAWGLTWRAVAGGRNLAAAAAATGLTIACHFIAGYLVLLTVGVWVLVLGGGWLRGAGRAALAAGGALLVASWVLVPLVGDRTWSNQSEYYRGTIFNDSYGASRVLHWLVHGQLFDDGRFPVVTLLAAAGAAWCLARARRDLAARALLGAFALSLALFFGRRTWGGLIDLLPGMSDVQIHRFVMGVDLAGILLAGVGLGLLARRGQALAARALGGRRALAAPAAVALCVGLLAPAWVERARYDSRGAAEIRVQQRYDATAGAALDRLVAIVKRRHDGRVYAGLRANWGAQYRVGYVPVYAWLAQQGVDAIGFTFRTVESLSTDPEAAFDETSLAQYQMLNVRYLLLPAGHPPPVPARLLAASGGNRLYEVQTSGYVQVVDRSAALAADRTDVEQATRAFRASGLALRSVYPGVAFAGGAAPPPTFAGPAPPPGPPGTVVAQGNRLQDGVFTATVVARRPAVVLLKATYDPRWTATVDGAPAKPVMMAPSLVGVSVPPGVHAVVFRYAPYGSYPLLLALGVLSLLGLWLYPRRSTVLARLDRRRAPGALVEAARAAAAAGSGVLPALRGWLARAAVAVEAPPVAAAPRRAAARALGAGALVRAERGRLLAVALVSFGIFLPAVIVPYAFDDDYPMLALATGLGPVPLAGNSVLGAFAANGRPLGGLLSSIAYSAAGTLDNLRYVRLVSILAIVALALLLHWSLVRAGVRSTLAALTALLMCSMPPFVVFATLSTAFTASLAAVLGAGASILAVAAVDRGRREARGRVLGAAAMLVAALLMYQQTAMVFWVFLGIALVGAARDPGRARRLLRRHGEAAVVALPLGFLGGKLSSMSVQGSTPNTARFQLTHDVVGKAAWFFAHPLYQALSLFELRPAPVLAAVVAAVAVGGLALLVRRECASPRLYVAAALALVPLSFLPTLLARENNSIAFRTQVALTPLVALYAVLGGIGIWRALSPSLARRAGARRAALAGRLATGALAAVSGLSLLLALRDTTTLVVLPQSEELQLIRSHVAELPSGVTRVGYVLIGWNEGITPWYSDEIGIPSSARPWVPASAVLLVLREQGRLPAGARRPTVDVVPFYDRPPANEPIIDLRPDLQRLRGGHGDWPCPGCSSH